MVFSFFLSCYIPIIFVILFFRLNYVVVNEIHMAFLSCSIDTFLIQSFTVDESTFEGKWEIAQQEMAMNLKELIGTGGMRNCYRAEITNFPKQFDVPAPNGWVAKEPINEDLRKTYDLCKKVCV